MMKNGTFYTSIDRQGNYILWRGYSNGKSFSKKVKYKPTFYLPTKESDYEYTSLIGDKPLKEKKFETMHDAKEFLEKYQDVSGFEICGNSNFIYQFIQEYYPNEIKFDMNLINLFQFDIEVDISDGYPNIDEADKPLTSVTMKSSKNDSYHLFALKDYDKEKTIIEGIDPKNIHFTKFDNEEEMLLAFIDLWTRDFPDIVSGWNCAYFDIMYIITRIIRLFGESKAKRLSPWGLIKKRTIEIYGNKQSTYNILGISVIDYMDAFKKFGYKYGTQESYKLDHIAYTVLGEKKLDYTEYGSLTALYEENPQLYLDYNLKDTYLIQRLEDETSLLSLVLTVAYSGGVNHNDAFKTVGIWDSTIYRKLMSKNIVPNVKTSPGEEAEGLVGGFVKDPIPGMYDWVISLDLASLYPHLMLQYNMSPETYMDIEKEPVSQDIVLEGKYENPYNDRTICANGVAFSKNKVGIIPEIIDEYYNNRKKIKKEMITVENELELIKEQLKERELEYNDK